jgi:hypothetical protein
MISEDEKISSQITTNNIQNIRMQISQKNKNTPYMSSGSVVENVITDMDHMPYSRFFRGVYYFPEPIIMEREAGYREVENSCYSVNRPYTKDYYSGCFQPACTTTFPCYHKPDIEERKINESCVIQYR